MDNLDVIGLLAQLDDEYCALNHGPATQLEKRSAVDFIIQPIGYKENDIEEIAVREMIIPVCIECMNALQGTEWVLFYCIDCCASQWVLKTYSKNRYRHTILWLKGCPECSKEFGGLYFTDGNTESTNVNLASRFPVDEVA